jgi:DNA-directed RNA polymerase subunit beta
LRFCKSDRAWFYFNSISKSKNGQVDLSNEGVIYLTAEEEEGQIIAQANAKIDDEGKFINPKVKARLEGDYPLVDNNEVQLMDVGPNQIASIAASLITFLEHDDANRALMGSNMMRQAVPLIKPEAPIVGTGLEARVVEDSRVHITAEGNGVVEFVDANEIIISMTYRRSTFCKF